MDFAFDQEQEELRSTARAFLAEHSGPEQVRAAMESELGYDPAVWKQLGAELGWTAVGIPEAYGGLGLGAVELTAILELMGESLLCAPYFSTLALGANALLVAGSEEQRQAHLPAIAAGEARATLAVAEASGCVAARDIATTAAKDGGDWRLAGRKEFVLDGHCADWVVVAARAAGSEGEDGVSLFRVSTDAAGLSRHAVPTMDQTRRLSVLELADVRVPDAERLGPAGKAWPLVSEILDRAAIALAAEQVGGAQRCLDMSVDYAKQREQFGRPIGSFQALKHKIADMMVQLESARSAAYYAACVAAESSDPASAEARAELRLVAPLAKAWCSDAYFACAAESIQIHGGVGFTWEYDCHLHFKRARSSEVFLGDPAFHRELVAQRIGL